MYLIFICFSAATPPEIVKPLKNANCIQNHNAQFTCTITGQPRPVITWYKGKCLGLCTLLILI